MSRVCIGFDYRVKSSSYYGLDVGVWPRSGVPELSGATNGLNLLDELNEAILIPASLVVAFDARVETIQHLASTFGLSHMLSNDSSILREKYQLIGFDVVDLYIQETFLTHIDSKGYKLNQYGLFTEESIAEEFSKTINDQYNYDSVGVWLSSP